MVKRILLALCALGIASRAESYGINLSWDDCGTAGVSNKTIACDTNIGPDFMLVGSFVPPAGVTKLSAEGITLDFGSEVSVLPDWWRFKTAGSCRETALFASTDFASISMMTCSDYWGTAASGSVSSYVTPYNNRACWARLRMVFAVPPTSFGPVDETQEYYAFRLHISRVKTVGDSACAGCLQPLAIEFNTLELSQTPELLRYRLDFPIRRNFVTWQDAKPPPVERLPQHPHPQLDLGRREVALSMRCAMRKAIATVFCTWMAAAPAQAAGLNLSWDDCGEAGIANKMFACDTNIGPAFMLVGSFFPPAGATQVNAEDIVVDIGSVTATLPDWWRFKTAGSCRQTALTASADFASLPLMSCADHWGIPVSGLISAYVTPYSGVACRAQLRASFAIPPANASPMDETLEYYAFRIMISRAATVGSGACGGCYVPVYLTLTEIKLRQSSGVADFRLQTPAVRNSVSWQGAGWNSCLPVPTRNATWGAVKTLYQ